MSQQYYSGNTSAYNEDGRLTYAVQRIILANIVVFAAQLVLHIVFGKASPFGVVFDPINEWIAFSGSSIRHGYLWTPVTYMFLHGGLSHLFFNMLWLYFFGPEVERALGTRQFFFFYLFTGALGVLVTALPIPILYSPAVLGASGAIMGVVIAFAVLNPERNLYLFPLPMPINARALVIIVIIFNVLMPLLSAGNAGDPGVSVGAHLGGMAVGYLYMKVRPKLFSVSGSRSKSKKNHDPVGEAVDNIFRLDDRKRGKK